MSITRGCLNVTNGSSWLWRVGGVAAVWVGLVGCQSPSRKVETEADKEKVRNETLQTVKFSNQTGLSEVSPAANVEFARQRMRHLALETAENPSQDWDPSQRDCAGLVRYLYRKAVTGHAQMWQTKQILTEDQTPKSPSNFATAGELVAYNFEPVSREIAGLRTGDLLVYHRTDRVKPEDAWHLMMVLEPVAGTDRPLVIYHNGGRGAQGEIRKVWLQDLQTAPLTEWRPDKKNKNFVGVYRWKGWVTQ